MSKIHILHIVGGMNRAGAETMVMNLYRKIDRDKFQFDFIVFSEDKFDYEDDITELGGRIIRIISRSALGRFFKLLMILKRGRWKIIHSHTLFSSGLHLLAARISRIPLRVVHSHNTSDVNSNKFYGRVYQRAMRYLINSVGNQKVACGHMAAQFLFGSEKHVVIMSNAIEVTQFVNADGAAIIRELNLSSESLILLQVGRLVSVKNHVYTLKIVRYLVDKGYKPKLLLVGTGPLHQQITSSVQEEELEDYVVFLGTRSDIPELMAASDIMVMPSLHEGFPVTLVESQAAGLPAIISTAISPEVDLNLGLIHRIPLSEPFSVWGDKLAEYATSQKPSVIKRHKTLHNAGFAVDSNIKTLTDIYSNAYH